MIERKRVNPGFDIGEVLHKKRSHVLVDLVAIWHRQIGMRVMPRSLAFLLARGLGELSQGKTVPNVPGNARQLASAIGETSDKVGKWGTHASIISRMQLLPEGRRLRAPVRMSPRVCAPAPSLE